MVVWEDGLVCGVVEAAYGLDQFGRMSIDGKSVQCVFPFGQLLVFGIFVFFFCLVFGFGWEYHVWAVVI